jgi:4-amino-4-deoxy-L-arabinose transferase-like glycosyltransferase
MDLRGPRFYRILLVLVGLGLLVRVAAVLVLGDYRQPLTAEYGIVAQNLAEGRGFVGGGWLGPEAPTALNVPVYPLFVAGWLKIGVPLPFLGVELAQALLSALLIYVVAEIALRLSDRLTALLAGGFVALYPPLIYFCKQISPAIVATFLASVSFCLLLALRERPTWARAIASGAVFGLALLAEPILLYALPGVALIELAQSHAFPRQVLGTKLLAAGAVGAMVLLPWMIRNYAVLRQPFLLKTSFGLNLWMGNNPNATGIPYTLEGRPMQETLSLETRTYLATLNEAERYSALAKKAWAWIKANPQKFLTLTAKRVEYLWWMSPTYQITTENITEPQFFYAARAWIQAVVLALGLVGGGVAAVRNRRLLVLCLWWLLAFTVPYAISIAGNTRYRLPAESMILILIAFGLAEGIRQVIGSGRRQRLLEVRA